MKLGHPRLVIPETSSCIESNWFTNALSYWWPSTSTPAFSKVILSLWRSAVISCHLVKSLQQSFFQPAAIASNQSKALVVRSCGRWRMHLYRCMQQTAIRWDVVGWCVHACKSVLEIQWCHLMFLMVHFRRSSIEENGESWKPTVKALKISMMSILRKQHCQVGLLSHVISV